MLAKTDKKNTLKFKMETWFDKNLDFFPMSVMFGMAFFIYQFIMTKSLFFIPAIILFPYLYPLLSYKFVSIFYPLKDGRFYLSEGGFPPWVGAFKFQLFLNTFPFFEFLKDV